MRQDFKGTGERWYCDIPTSLNTMMGRSYAAAVKQLKKEGFMDADANLEEQRRLSHLLIEVSLTSDEYVGYAQTLAERVKELDKHMTKGGAPPKAWKSPNS